MAYLKKLISVFGAVLFLAVGASFGGGGQAANPEPKFKLTVTERIRQESQDNVTSLNQSVADGGSYMRFRTSLMGQWRMAGNFSLVVRLTNENRYYLTPKTDPRNGRDYNVGEGFIDYLYAQWKNAAGLPLTLTVGRQDMMLGEGLVIWDGGPLDGSRSAYFNAVRGDWAWSPKAVLTAFYCYQPSLDNILPLLNDAQQKMVEQGERGFGLYFTGTAGQTGVEAYLFRKNGRGTPLWPALGLTTAGLRTILPLSTRLSLTAEGAYQSGVYGGLDRIGWGGYFHFDFKTNAAAPLPAVLTFGGLYLSGDDPATPGRYEGWDPAFARWPKWSESLIYLLARETGRPAYWSNLTSLNGSLQFALADNLKLLTTLHFLGAAERTKPSALWSGAGLDRGRLTNIRLTCDVSKNLSGHFWVDYFKPGNFYFAGAHSFVWVRFELLFRY
jgi:hypothetical protein